MQRVKGNVGWNGEGRTRFGRDHGVDVAGAGEGVGVGGPLPVHYWTRGWCL